jgi:hypothetical protein
MEIAHLSWLPDCLQPVLYPSLYNRGVIHVGWAGVSLMQAQKKSGACWYYFNH